MQASDYSAVPSLECADRVAAVHGVSGDEGRDDRLVGRQHLSGVGEREHRTIDDVAGEVHHAVGGCVHGGRGGLDVDAAVSRSVGSGGSQIGPGENARWVDGPLPARGRGGHGGGGGEQQDQQEMHRTSVGRDDHGEGKHTRPVENPFLCRNAMILAALRMSG